MGDGPESPAEEERGPRVEPRPQKEGDCVGWAGRRAAGQTKHRPFAPSGMGTLSAGGRLPAPQRLPCLLEGPLVPEALSMGGTTGGLSGMGTAWVCVAGVPRKASVLVLSRGHPAWSLQVHGQCVPSSGRGTWGADMAAGVVFLGQTLLVSRPRRQGDGVEAFPELSSVPSTPPPSKHSGATLCSCLMSERRLLAIRGRPSRLISPAETFVVIPPAPHFTAEETEVRPHTPQEASPPRIKAFPFDS